MVLKEQQVSVQQNLIFQRPSFPVQIDPGSANTFRAFSKPFNTQPKALCKSSVHFRKNVVDAISGRSNRASNNSISAPLDIDFDDTDRVCQFFEVFQKIDLPRLDRGCFYQVLCEKILRSKPNGKHGPEGTAGVGTTKPCHHRCRPPPLQSGHCPVRKHSLEVGRSVQGSGSKAITSLGFSPPSLAICRVYTPTLAPRSMHTLPLLQRTAC